MKALITGATGFVGKRLLHRLNEPAVVLSRNAAKAEKTLSAFKVKAFNWDAENQPAPAEAFDGVDAVFHLAGDPVAEGRWTEEKKRRMRASRVEGTRNLVNTLAQLPKKPRVLVSASAVGYYGDRGDEVLTEDADPRDDLLAEVCVAWERESHAARHAGIRVVNPRIGIVLGEKGGAISKMLTPFKFGVGSPLGTGKQYMPWIHINDLVSLMLFAAERDSISGPLNGTAPNPVTNYEFTKTLGRVLNRPTFMPAPPNFMLKLLIGEFANVLLASQNAVPKRPLDAGFQFQYPTLEPALREILN
ncbi:TIGR01777 family oxidoreductase [Anatilimnocola floriformis]|uniref:TIGR01777 family oxidoreductase n=1 Tax=Anatilimnocola floriformis TaxID=2948575 RepID=UPI0020C3D7AD|nr:TIGR01777 family oxidoreductase [Anatilimnocola floriformis]